MIYLICVKLKRNYFLYICLEFMKVNMIKKLFVGDKILLLIIKVKVVEYVSDINCVEWWLKNNI